MNIYDKIICEYSPVQRAFHVDTLGNALKANRVAVSSGLNPGYLPLALFDTDAEADRFIREFGKHG